jgi:hypothetical protein
MEKEGTNKQANKCKMQLKFVKVMDVHSEVTSVEASACIKPPQPPKNL